LTKLIFYYTLFKGTTAYTIFNIKGNQYRLIVKINYKARILYFKKFLTHTEYDKIKWDNEDEVKQKIG